MLARGVGSISDVASAIKEGSFSLRVAHVRADLQTPGAASQPSVFSSGGSSNLPRGAHPKPALAAKTTVARQQQVSAGARPGPRDSLVRVGGPVHPRGHRAAGG